MLHFKSVSEILACWLLVLVSAHGVVVLRLEAHPRFEQGDNLLYNINLVTFFLERLLKLTIPKLLNLQQLPRLSLGSVHFLLTQFLLDLPSLNVLPQFYILS